MKVGSIAGFAVISKDASASVKLYKDDLGLPLEGEAEYQSMNRFPGTNHFGVWPLQMAAECCFGKPQWPTEIPEPTSTLEFEFQSIAEVKAAEAELKAKGYTFVHDTRLEEWGQTTARFLSPENVLIGLSYAPWLHED